MNCKIVTAAELPKVMALWDYCFEKEEDPFFQWYFREYCLRHNLILGGFSEEDGHLQNMLQRTCLQRRDPGRKESKLVRIGGYVKWL